MAVSFDNYLISRLTDFSEIEKARTRKRIEKSYSGIIYALSLLYEEHILESPSILINIFKSKFKNRELYFELHYIFNHHKQLDGLIVEEIVW